MFYEFLIGDEIGSGYENLVFQHPRDSNLLIKVIIPLPLRNLKIPENPIKERKSVSVFNKWKWEIKAISKATMQAGRVLDFLENNYGFCDTSLGLGFIVGKVKDHAGNLAPSLEQVTERGLMPLEKIHGIIDTIFEQIRDAHLITWDTEAKNFVITGKYGAERLVLIDGIGDRAVFPIREYSNWLATKSQNQKLVKLHRWVRENYNSENKLKGEETVLPQNF